jgi:hypothetical protein
MSNNLTENNSLLASLDQSGCFNGDEIRDAVLNKLTHLISSVLVKENEFSLANIKIFDVNDPFLTGKLMQGFATVLSQVPESSSAQHILLTGINKMAKLTTNKVNTSWGIYFYLTALLKFDQNGLMHVLFSYQQLNALRNTLHWKNFINEKNYQLINKPNNYYQLAYSIACLRFQLGWDSAEAIDIFLNKMIKHYEECPGISGYADETDGQGRYDRYSVLLIAEIAHRFRENGLPLTLQLKKWLKRSAELVLMHANNEGVGFQYGRSIGPYGDSLVNEVLSIAAWNDVLSAEEKKMAFTYSYLSTKRFLDFWWDDSLGCVNIWFKGRKTDDYRGKHRILGESLSLLHQHIYTTEIWSSLGFAAADISIESYNQWQSQLPRFQVFEFAKGINNYLVAIYRAKGKVFTLPLVNGDLFYDKSFYLPIPYNNKCIQGIPDRSLNILVPKLTLPDGAEVMPICWFDNVKFEQVADSGFLSYSVSGFSKSGNNKPNKDGRFKSTVCYQFEQNFLKKTENISFEHTYVDKVVVKFLSFYEAVSNSNESVIFAIGPISKVEVKGFDSISIICVKNDGFSSNDRLYHSMIFFVFSPHEIKDFSLELKIYFRDAG